MSTETQPSTDLGVPVPWLRPARLAERWLWHGILSPGMITAFTSRGQSGKTTLASILLARLQTGGTLAGLPLAAGTAIVATNEFRVTWDERCRRLGVGPNVRFLIQPFYGMPPKPAQWLAFATALTRLHREEPFDLLLLDPLVGFLPSTAPALLDCLLPLQELAAAGTAIWLLHRPRKRDAALRSTSALAGFADIVMEMSCIKPLHTPDRRRRLRAHVRTEATPRHLLIELNAAGTDYTVYAEALTVEGWAEVAAILAVACTKLTHADIIAQWPADRAPPPRATLYRWLRAALLDGRLCCCGTGERGDPYRYWLAARTPLMCPDGKEEHDA